VISSSWWRLGRASFAAAAAAVVCWTIAPPRPAAQSSGSSCAIQTTQRIIAVGDVHGAYDKFVAILREAGVIDSRRRWIAGRAIFVQTGDLVDRGPDSREAIDLLRKLEAEAERAGGRVHVLIGNHEVMRVFTDRRYISAGEYKEFESVDSETLREQAYDLLLKEHQQKARSAKLDFDVRAFRKQFLQDNPLGALEMQIAFGQNGEYGKWIRERDAMIKINGIVFVHGGVSPAVAAMGCAAVNAAIRGELKTSAPPADPERALVTAADGPMWFRGLVDTHPGALAPADFEGVLKALEARFFVIGHTAPPDFKMRAGFEGRVVQIDTGMVAGEFFPGGMPSALEIMGDTFTAIYEGRREVILPVGGK
jgi:hypothetical protein